MGRPGSSILLIKNLDSVSKVTKKHHTTLCKYKYKHFESNKKSTVNIYGVEFHMNEVCRQCGNLNKKWTYKLASA